MSHRYTFEEVEKYLLSLPELGFEDFKYNYKAKTLHGAIYSLLEDSSYSTTIILGTGEYICSGSSRRSIGDIYRILHTYYNEVTFEEVFNELQNMCEHNILISWVCEEIGRRVYIIKNLYYDPTFHGTSDEFGFYFPPEHSKVSDYSYGRYKTTPPEIINIYENV